MKISYSVGDRVAYILGCLFTFGGLWVLRLAISEGIRQSLEWRVKFFYF